MIRLTRIIILLSLVFTVTMNDKTISQGQATTNYELVYISNDAEVQNFDVFRSDLEGQNPVRLTYVIDALFDRYANDASCSSDGNYVYLTTTTGIYGVNADGTNFTEIVGGGLFDQLDLSSLDDELVFSASDTDSFPQEHDNDIYLYNLASQNLQLLTNNTRQDTFPDFSPDRSKIVFSFHTNESPVISGIAVMNRNGSGETILLQDSFDNFDPVWSPDGSKIMFSSNRSGTYNLYTMNSDGTNLNPLMTIEGNAYGRWSPDGELISFTSDRDGTLDIYVMNADGSNLRQVTNNGATNYNQCWLLSSQTLTVPSLSLLDATGLTIQSSLLNNASIDLASVATLPLTFRANSNPATIGSVRFELNGTVVFTDNSAPYAYTWMPPIGNYSLTATPYSGANASGTAGTALTRNFTVSNSHNRILYSRLNLSTGDSEIYLMNADGSNRQSIVHSSGYDSYARWSLKGNRFVFASNRDGDYEIFIANADGSNQIQLTSNSANDMYPAFSPDGTRIAYASVSYGTDWEIVVMDTDGNNKFQITINNSDDLYPAWSPDGTRLAFNSNRDGNSEIYTMNPDGTNPLRLTNRAGNDRKPNWSPDGSRIVFTAIPTGTTQPEIYIMNADGNNQLRLTNNQGEDESPNWSFDGSQIIFASSRGSTTTPPDLSLYIMNPDGSNPLLMSTVNNGADETWAAWGYP